MVGQVRSPLDNERVNGLQSAFLAHISCLWTICDLKNGKSQKMFRSVNIILDAKLKCDESEADS